MPLTIINESKNSLTITNEGKAPTGSQITWDQATFTWDAAGNATWDVVGLVITNETKNSLDITNEPKT